MKTEKVLAFLKDNKEDLIIGAVSAVAGGAFAAFMFNHPFGKNQKLFKELRAFGVDKEIDKSITELLFEAQKGSNAANVFSGGQEMNIKEAADYMVKFYEEKGVNLDTEVTGLAVFLKKS